MADRSIKLLPGYRFHPTDEEIIANYLVLKNVSSSYTTPVMGEVDLNKVERCDLPSKARMGEKEWYFFSHQGKKYPTGTRVDRSTEAGFWKTTGKDRDIFNDIKELIGKRKTLVFYTGRAPWGEKTNWVMKEFRIEGCPYPNLPAKKGWVVSRVFFKGPIDERETMNPVVLKVVQDSATRPSLVDASSLMDVSHFNSIESMSSSYKGPMTTDWREKMKSVAPQLLPETVTLPSLLVVSDFYSTPALSDISNFSSGNSVCPENSLENKSDIEATFNYFRSSYAYGAPVYPHIYDPYFDDQGPELIRALCTFDGESDCAIGRHTNEDQVWNHKMMVGTSQDTPGTGTNWNMDDLWMLKENEMGCYDVEDLDDAKKMKDCP